MPPEKKSIQISLDPVTAKGTYSNLCMITHSKEEFILDFAQNLPGMPGPAVATRVVVSPDHAKRILAALSDNIEKYENAFGEIGGGKGTFIVPSGGASA